MRAPRAAIVLVLLLVYIFVYIFVSIVYVALACTLPDVVTGLTTAHVFALLCAAQGAGLIGSVDRLICAYKANSIPCLGTGFNVHPDACFIHQA
jgi:hypothetical protein